MLKKTIVLILLQLFSSFDSKAQVYGLEMHDDTNITNTSDSLTPTCPPGPIDVNTNRAKLFIELSNVIYHISIYPDLLVKNTGHSVTFTPKESNSGNIVSGGALGNKQYSIQEIELFWTEDGTGSSGPTIDGKGEPLQAAFKFIEMTKKIDAFIVFVGVKVENTNGKTNSRFEAIQKNGLNKIKTPGSEVILNHLETMSWLILDAKMQNYYIYSADIQFQTGPVYKCAKVVQLDSDPERTISYEESLQMLKLNGSSSSNTMKVYPNDGISVGKCKGIEAKIDNYVYTGTPTNEAEL